uniref:Uncharacterized protein n=1 Tax=Macrostomum lignano TaxID=282301 RepID=A0A1I8G1Z8_9PLAT
MRTGDILEGLQLKSTEYNRLKILNSSFCTLIQATSNWRRIIRPQIQAESSFWARSTRSMAEALLWPWNSTVKRCSAFPTAPTAS